MHARQSVTSVRETEPAGNSEKSNTSRACFGLDAFALLDATAFFDAFDAAFVFVAPTAFDAAAFFEDFDAAGFFAADFFGAFAAAAFAFAAGLAFFAVVFELFLVAAI